MAGSVRNLPTLRILDLDLHEHIQSAGVDDARASLQQGLRSFDPSATPFFVGLQITPDGIVVRGDVSTAPRPVPVVDVRETPDGGAFTAFNRPPSLARTSPPKAAQ